MIAHVLVMRLFVILIIITPCFDSFRIYPVQRPNHWSFMLGLQHHMREFIHVDEASYIADFKQRVEAMPPDAKKRKTKSFTHCLVATERLANEKQAKRWECWLCKKKAAEDSTTEDDNVKQDLPGRTGWYCPGCVLAICPACFADAAVHGGAYAPAVSGRKSKSVAKYMAR